MDLLEDIRHLMQRADIHKLLLGAGELFPALDRAGQGHRKVT